MRVRRGVLVLGLTALAAWGLLRAFPVRVGMETILTPRPLARVGLFNPIRDSEDPRGSAYAVQVWLAEGVATKLDPILEAAGGVDGRGRRGGRPPLILNETKAVEVLVALRQALGTQPLRAPRVVVRGGTSAFVQVLNQQSYVSAIETTSDGALAPVVDVGNSGMELQVWPTTRADGAGVDVRVSAGFERLHRLATIPFPDGPPGSDVTFQRPERDGWALESTFTLPPNCMAVFAMTEQANGSIARPTTRPTRAVLLIRADIVVGGTTTRPR